MKKKYSPDEFAKVIKVAAATIERIKKVQSGEVSPVKRREYLEAQRRELMARKKA